MQQQRRHIPISGEIICEKARLFHREITKQGGGFTISRDWLDNFKHRHGIRRFKITGKIFHVTKHQSNHFEMNCSES